MNKVAIALVLLTVCAVSSAQSFPDLWDTCQDQIKNLSIYIDKNADKKTIYTALDNCLSTWYSDSEQRAKCESDAGLNTADSSIKDFYNDCYKPYQDERNLKCYSEIVCPSERDKCTACKKDTSCKTPNNNNMVQLVTDKDAIYSGTDSKCPAEFKNTVNCNQDTLKKIAYDSCYSYNINKCADYFYAENFKDDGCYDYQMCKQSAALLKIALISLIAFFAF